MARYSRRVTGVCGMHSWRRWVVRRRKCGVARVRVKVGLGVPRPDDFCEYCRQPRAVVEGIVA